MMEYNLKRHKLTNLLHSLVLLAGLLLLFGVLGWMIGGAVGVLWSTLLALGSIWFAPRISPQFVLRLYGARPVPSYQAPQLMEIRNELAARAGLSVVPRLYYIPTRMLNAFTVGTRQDAAIAVTDGLLRTLTLRELSTVLAHEMSHIRNNDLWVMGLADLTSRLIGIMSIVGLLLLVVSLPLMLLGGSPLPVLPLLILIFAPNLSVLLQSALSRAREYDADLEAVRLTGDPRGLAQALAKLERYQGGWMEQVLFPGRKNPDPSLLRTHPRTEERIQRLLSLEEVADDFVPLRRRLEQHAVGRYDFPLVTQDPRWRIGGLWF